VKLSSRSNIPSKRSTLLSRRFSYSPPDASADEIAVLIQMKSTASPLSVVMSLSPLLKWDGASPSAPSLPCTRIHSVHSISPNSQNVSGETSTLILKNVNSPGKQQMSIQNVLSYISSLNLYTSYIPRSVFIISTGCD
jgi:hypothetical protein